MFTGYPLLFSVILAVVSFVAFLGSVFAIEVSKRNGWGQTGPILSAGLALVLTLINIDTAMLTQQASIVGTETRHWAWMFIQVYVLVLIFVSVRGAYRTNQALKILKSLSGKVSSK